MGTSSRELLIRAIAEGLGNETIAPPEKRYLEKAIELELGESRLSEISAQSLVVGGRHASLSGLAASALAQKLLSPREQRLIHVRAMSLALIDGVKPTAEDVRLCRAAARALQGTMGISLFNTGLGGAILAYGAFLVASWLTSRTPSSLLPGGGLLIVVGLGLATYAFFQFRRARDKSAPTTRLAKVVEGIHGGTHPQLLIHPDGRLAG